MIRVILGMAAAGTLFPLMGAACAFLLRSGAGAIATVLAAIFAPAIVGALLPEWWQRNVLVYLPGDSVALSRRDA